MQAGDAGDRHINAYCNMLAIENAGNTPWSQSGSQTTTLAKENSQNERPQKKGSGLSQISLPREVRLDLLPERVTDLFFVLAARASLAAGTAGAAGAAWALGSSSRSSSQDRA